MKILFIGGTGLISSACSELAVERGYDLSILNRSVSAKYPVPEGARLLVGDVHGDAGQLEALLAGDSYDAVVDWIAFTPEDIRRDLALFGERAGQFVFISSASAYQKPPRTPVITEETPLENPFWEYARQKIACENLLMEAYQQRGFPVTIVRPSLTYGPSQIPLVWASWQHPYTVVDRMLRGQKVIVPGDGTSLWVVTWNGDFAVGFLGLLGNPQAVGEAFHITSDEVLTWDAIFEETARAVGVEPNIIHIPSDLIAAYDPGARGTLTGDKSNSCIFDNRKIKQLVPEFVCQVPWAEGVRRSLDWFRADPARQSIDAEMNRRWDQVIAGYEQAWPGV
jgi:nucleoside-diphosphate-sugar epimerase